MNTLDALAGVLHVRPGAPRPYALSGTRPDWAATLSRGRPAHELPALLGSVFSLCGQAHRLCAQAAVDAARGRPGPAGDTLRMETLREHLRRILIDWPAQLAGAEPEDVQQALASCPALRPGGDAAQLAHWLEHRLLGADPASWLDRCRRGAFESFVTWRDAGATWLARLLRDLAPAADLCLPADPPLRVHADAAALHALSDALAQDPAYSRQPQIDGGCAETGCWTRLDDIALPGSASGRLAARLTELVALALPGGDTRLRSGSIALAPGAGLAWAEMARGLLVHRVQLDRCGDDARVEACQVLAPTEWNFHPQGAVARALEALDADAPDIGRQVALTMAAWDPCVRYRLDREPEVAHA